MDSVPTEISRWSDNYLNLDNLIRQIFQHKSSEGSFASVENHPAVRSALVDFYNDFRTYKDALKEIKKVQSEVANVQIKGNLKINQKSPINSLIKEKYTLLRPISLLSQRKSKLNEERRIQGCILPDKLQKSASDSELQSSSSSNISSKCSTRLNKIKRSIIKPGLLKLILIAEPEIIEFLNCKSGKIYKKTIIVRNVDIQLARFKIESRPARSPFTIFVESARKSEKEDIAPGMHIKLHVHFRSDELSEPEETLVLNVQNGKSVFIRIKVRRDPPILKAVAQIFLSTSFTKRFSEMTLESENGATESSELKSCRTNRNSGSTAENLESTSDSLYLNDINYHSSFDCKKCFVGEYVIVAVFLKNHGGKGRFFIMSEIDWCLMSIEDVTSKNMLIVPPFAIWPAYFELQSKEEITMYIHFFPNSYGLQTDELYIISDNCSLKTIELMGDAIVFEPQMFQYDKNVKYQWFQTRKNGHFCTIRYVDLGFGISGEILENEFGIISTCELDLYYRWEVKSTLLCPAECKNTVGRKDFCSDKLKIEPSSGSFQFNVNTIFKVTANLCHQLPAHYRSTLLLIIEDVPLAAVPKKYNYPYEESTSKRRLCENSVDIHFENIEIRIRCMSVEENYELIKRLESKNEETLYTVSLMDITDFSNNSYFLTDPMKNMIVSESDSSRSDGVCRFIKGYGTCDCCQATMISTAVLRPGGPLFVGVESRFTAVLCNRSSKRIKYWWGNAVGPDHTKLKIIIEPKFDDVGSNSYEIIEIYCLPLETGEISQIFIPCQFEGRNPLILSIDCTVKALSLAFYFPIMFDEMNLVSNMIRIEWNANDYVSFLDKKTGQIKLSKPKLKKEKLLYTTVLNSSVSLNKTDSEIQSSYGENEESITSTEISSDEQRKSKSNTTNDHSVLLNYEESWEEEYEEDESKYMKILPYFDFYDHLIKQNFRYLPLVIEFYVTPGKKLKKRIYLQNESPICTTFSIQTRNFWGNLENETTENGNEFFEDLKTGLEMKVEPIKGNIKSYETITFDIIASSNTWGIYTDQITVSSDFLPPYSFWVRIINNNTPISYPICKNSLIKIPKIRFKVFKPRGLSNERKILLENTSAIPLYIHWHCFLLNDNSVLKPFNVILDMFTPFVNIEELFETNSSFYNAIKRYFSCALNPYKSKDNLTEIMELNNSNKITESSGYSFDSKNKGTENGDSLSKKFSYLQSNNGQSSQVIQRDDEFESSSLTPVSINKPPCKDKTTEIQLSIVPYYGELIYDLFNITPQELYIPPKEKRYISITVNTEKLKLQSQKILCKACGFIRIPPIFKYRDNVFFRKDGYYLPPTEVLLECLVDPPKLILQSSKSQNSFEFHAKDFIQQMKNEITIKKDVVFTNLDGEIIEVSFEIHKPFRIKQVSTQREIFDKKYATVHPGESIKIEIKATFNQEWMQKIIDLNKDKSLMKNHVKTKKTLICMHKDGFTQATELSVKIYLPTLEISTNYLNFGEVLVGESKTYTFYVKNLAERPQHFEIKMNEHDNSFTFFPRKALLTSRKIRDTEPLQITACFIPKTPGIFTEIVNIISELDGLVSKCHINGCGVTNV